MLIITSEDEGDECRTASLDLYGRSQSPTEQQQTPLEDAGDRATHGKKRKMDVRLSVIRDLEHTD